VLFINAEREITTGRSRNYLDPRHVEKIVTTFRSWRNIPHFSKVVSIDEIAQNEFNLNIRRYVDTNPTVRVRLDSHALLFGGVPKTEVEAQRDRFRAFGIDVAGLFADEEKDHLGIPSDGGEAIAERISAWAATSEQRFLDHLRDWFQFEGRSPLAHLTAPHETRHHLINSFRNNLLAAGILDEHQLTGVFADWWAAHRDDLRELANASRHDTLAPAANAKLRKTIPNSLEEDLTERAKKLVRLARQELVETYRSWVDRYGTSLQELNVRRAESEDRLRWRLRHLGYDWPFDR
jgi:type I restriction enzyme M protein